MPGILASKASTSSFVRASYFVVLSASDAGAAVAGGAELGFRVGPSGGVAQLDTTAAHPKSAAVSRKFRCAVLRMVPPTS
jgi:hypothetical protein